MQARCAGFQQPFAQFADHIEAEGAHRFGVIAETFELLAHPARQLGAAGVGETGQFGETGNGHDAGNDGRLDAFGGTFGDEVLVGIGIVEILGDGGVGSGVDLALEGKQVPGTRGTVGTSDGDGGGACTPDKYLPGTDCTVKFSTDIFPNMAATAAWQCASEMGCHGGKNPASQPVITTDPKTTWENFRQFANIDSTRPYINPCSTDPATSTFLCNVIQGTGSCGKPMPLTPGAPVDVQARATIETWIKCGAPNN